MEWFIKALNHMVKTRGKEKEVTQSHLKLVVDTLTKLNKQEEAEKIQKTFQETKEIKHWKF